MARRGDGESLSRVWRYTVVPLGLRSGFAAISLPELWQDFYGVVRDSAGTVALQRPLGELRPGFD